MVLDNQPAWRPHLRSRAALRQANHISGNQRASGVMKGERLQIRRFFANP
jgi:hypothetical protein